MWIGEVNTFFSLSELESGCTKVKIQTLDSEWKENRNKEKGMEKKKKNADIRLNKT